MKEVSELSHRVGWIRRLLQNGCIESPALVIDASDVGRSLAKFRSLVPLKDIYYAVKTNNDPSLLRMLAECGTSFDVSSAAEIEELLAIGVSPGRLLLSNPVKSPATIRAFLNGGLTQATIDNPFDLDSLGKAVPTERRSTVDLYLRVRIPTTDVQIDLNSKFGCCESEAINLLRDIRRWGFRPRGVQFQVVTQSWNVENYRVGIETSLRILEAAAREYRLELDTINIGGGFPDPLVARQAGSIDRFFTGLQSVIDPIVARGIRVIAEPGRTIVSHAGSAVCTCHSARENQPGIGASKPASGSCLIVLEIGPFGND